MFWGICGFVADGCMEFFAVIFILFNGSVPLRIFLLLDWDEDAHALFTFLPGLYFKWHGTHRPSSMKKTITRRKRVPAAPGAGGSMSDQAAADAVGRIRVSPGGIEKTYGLGAINPDDTVSKRLLIATSYLI
jgi:hypothetical protein